MTMISDSAMLSELSAEFPGYEFSTQRTWEGVSLIAVRQKGSARSGLYVVITPDLDEMRRTLLDNTGLDSTGLDSTGLDNTRARGREPRTVAEGPPAIDDRAPHGDGVHQRDPTGAPTLVNQEKGLRPQKLIGDGFLVEIDAQAVVLA